jgi:hypothetical protein
MLFAMIANAATTAVPTGGICAVGGTAALVRAAVRSRQQAQKLAENAPHIWHGGHMVAEGLAETVREHHK